MPVPAVLPGRAQTPRAHINPAAVLRGTGGKFGGMGSDAATRVFERSGRPLRSKTRVAASRIPAPTSALFFLRRSGVTSARRRTEPPASRVHPDPPEEVPRMGPPHPDPARLPLDFPSRL